MHSVLDKASHLIEALPYIRTFSGKTFVIKLGGSALTDPTSFKNMMQDIALLFFCGIRPVLVHGGGPEISLMCEQLQIPVQFSEGQRITDDKTIDIVQMVLIGKINVHLVTALNQHGVKAVGLSGQDASFLKAEPLPHLGRVGSIRSVDKELLNTLITHQFIPVISPLAINDQGDTYNINADAVAGSVAGALKAEKLILLSDVNGLYANIDDPDSRLSSISTGTIKTWLSNKTIQGGMIPKLTACCDAINQGVASAHILDGTMAHSLLLEIFTQEGVGTMIKGGL